MKSKIVFILASLVLGDGCGSKSGGGGGTNGGLSAGQQATLQCLAGTWQRCSDDGNVSSRVTFTVTGSAFSETIESFNGNDTCAGASDASFSFTATLSVGNLGESTGSTGSTEITLTTNPDIYGCGTGAPAYTVMQFSSDCKQMLSAVGGPSCDFASRSVALDPLPFNKN